MKNCICYLHIFIAKIETSDKQNLSHISDFFYFKKKKKRKKNTAILVLHEILFRNSFKSLFYTQFLKDYYKFVKHHLSENYLPKNITRFPGVDELKEFAEKKFFEFFKLEPTCAVYAPGTLTIAGKCMGIAESKSVSMVGANSSIFAPIHCKSRFS